MNLKNRLFVAISAAALVASLSLIPLITLAESNRVPEALSPAAGEELAFVLAANGVQVYACKPSAKDPYSYAWSFVAPEATLAENGGPTRFRDTRLDDYLARTIDLGAAYGRFHGDPMDKF